MHGGTLVPGRPGQPGARLPGPLDIVPRRVRGQTVHVLAGLVWYPRIWKWEELPDVPVDDILPGWPQAICMPAVLELTRRGVLLHMQSRLFRRDT